MYWGSVKFYRHLIVGFVVLVIIITTILAFVFGIKSSRYKSLYRESQVLVGRLEDELENQLENPLLEVKTIDEVKDEKQEAVDSGIEYQNKYPDMYCEAQQPFEIPDNKTVYLTFDDGPSSVTPQILDTLAAHNVKATFFIVGKQLSDSGKQTLKRMADEGHTIGIHTNTHDYAQIYESVDTFLDDFYIAYNGVVEAIGYKPTVYRFPGGSINSYNQANYQEIIAEMARRGFVYYDWNSSAEDAVGGCTVASVKENSLKGVKEGTYSIILMHDTEPNTGKALDGIITDLKSQGYTFDSLNREVKPIIFSYR